MAIWELDEGELPPLVTFPGPRKIAIGDEQLGYYGILPSTEFIKGNALATAVGLTAGTALVDDVDWFKFAYKGKIFYVPQKVLRYGMNNQQLDVKGLVSGTKQITIGKYTYKVRLMRGSLANPYTGVNDASDDPKTRGSEYNDLIYRVCTTTQAKQTMNFAQFTPAQLGLVGNGGNVFMLEGSTPPGVNAGVLTRSNAAGDITTAHSPPYTYSDAGRGWRPVLELINP